MNVLKLNISHPLTDTAWGRRDLQINFPTLCVYAWLPYTTIPHHFPQISTQHWGWSYLCNIQWNLFSDFKNLYIYLRKAEASANSPEAKLNQYHTSSIIELIGFILCETVVAIVWNCTVHEMTSYAAWLVEADCMMLHPGCGRLTAWCCSLTVGGWLQDAAAPQHPTFT